MGAANSPATSRFLYQAGSATTITNSGKLACLLTYFFTSSRLTPPSYILSGSGSLFGSGVTISSFYANMFDGSTSKFSTTPLSGPQECVSFAYTLVSVDTLRNGRKNYILFCPIDDPLY